MRRFTVLLFLMLFAFAININGQVNNYTFTQSVGTYTTISGGTVHATGAWDDAMIPNIPIGFTFTFNGAAFTQVTISPNGYLIFGGTASLGYAPISSTTAAPGAVSPVGRDLQGAATSTIRSETIGTPGDYIYVVQWTDAKRFGTTYPDELMDFQIRLHQNGNLIELAYGEFTGATYPASPIHPQVGIRGANNLDFLNRTTTDNWLATTAGTLNSQTCAINATVKPVNGLSFVYSPPAGFPEPPVNPNPAIGAVGVPVNGSLSWDFGANTETYDLWFGPSGQMVKVVEDAPAGTSGSYAYSGLAEITAYQWQLVIKNALGVVNGPVWNFTTVFESGFTVTYAEGDIETDYGSPWVGPSTCPGSMMVTIPEGQWITRMDVVYSMTAANGAYMSEQRSKIYSPTLGAGESQYFAGVGAAAGTYNYSRQNLGFAVGALGEIEFLMDAGRTWGSAAPNEGCGVFYNKVVNGTWTLIFFTEDIPDCVAPSNFAGNNVTATSIDLSWTAGYNTSLWNLKYGVPGFDPEVGGELEAGIETTVYTLAVLNPNTAYDVYVQADCNEEAVSEWVGPISFTTLSLFDLAIVEILSPVSLCYDGAVPVTIVLTNLGGATVNVPFEVSYSIDGGTPVVETVNVPVAQNEVVQYTFTTPIDLVLTEDFTFDFTATVSLDGDSDPTNDELTTEVSFYVFPDAPQGVDATISAGSTAVLQAISPNDVFWYATPDDDNILGTGEFFETPELFSTTSFYAAAGSGVDFFEEYLQTTFAGGNGCGEGNMFDLQALDGDLTITGFTINPNATNAVAPVSIWTKSGTHVGFQNNQAAWTLRGTYTVNAVVLVPVYVDIDDFVVPDGEIMGVYVQYNSAYTNVTALTTYQNDVLAITGGSGFCTAFSHIANRMFNGRVHYLSRTSLCFSDRTEVTAFVPEGAVEGYVMEATRGAIEGARVFSGEYEAFTNADGYFFIDNVSATSYDFTAEAAGYFSQTIEGVEVLEGETTQIEFQLGYATIAVNPTSLTETLSPGFTSTKTLNIANDGVAPLTWSATVNYIDPESRTSGTLPSLGNQEPLPVIEHQPAYEISQGGSQATIKGAGKSLSNSRDVLWDNGPIVNSPGTGVGGADESILQLALGMSTYGAGVQQTASNSMADDFVVDSEWDVESFEFFVYQTGSSTTSTITGVFFRIWNGAPNAGGQIIYGNLTTNVLQMSEWSNIYRNDNGPGGLTNRPVMRVVAAANDLLLPAGTYWVEATFAGTLASGPWMPAITINGQTTTGNALQNVAGTWQSWVDVGGQGMPFIVNGTSNPWVSLGTYAGQVLPGESQSIDVNFDATELVDGTYLANININHNGQEAGRGMVTVPVSLTVAATQPPQPPFNFSPANNAQLVPLQPEFSWTNGAGTAQVRFQLVRFTGVINPQVYLSPWFTGNSINLAELPIPALLQKTNYRWQVFARNAAGEVASQFLFFQTVGSGSIGGIVTDSYTGQPMQGVSITADELRFSTETGADGSYLFTGVPEGQYNVTASFEGYNSESQTTTVVHGQTSFVSFELDIFLTAPSNLQAQVQDIFDVNLTWVEPGGAVILTEYRYDDGVRLGQLGFQTGTINSVLGSKHSTGATIHELSWLLSDDPNGGGPHATVQVYIFGLQPNGLPNGLNVLYTASVSNVDGVFNTHTLPVPVNAPNGFFIAVGYNGFAGLGTDDGIGAPYVFQNNTHYFSGDYTGNTWSTWESAAFSVNGMIRAYGVPGAVASFVVENNEEFVDNTHSSELTPELRLSKSPVSVNSPSWNGVIANNSKALTGYNVYRDGLLIGTTATTQYHDEGLDAGTYAYQVSAVYDEGESDLIGPATVSILAPPTLLSAEQVGDVIQLEWQSNFVGKGAMAGQAAVGLYSTASSIDFLKKENRTQAPYVAPENVRQGGNTIAEAFVITSIPYSVTGTTTGYTNDYDEVCPFTGSVAPDVVYAYTPAQNTIISIDLCGSSFDTKLYVYENEHTPGNAFACNDDFYGGADPCGAYVSALFNLSLTGGNTYYIVIDGYGTDNGDYVITITESEPSCTVECPPGAIAESEPCGDDLNGGCNMAIPAFEPISIGDVVCGTAWANGGTRDTDWYEFVITSPKLITFSVTAEFSSVIGLLEQIVPGMPGCENNTGFISPFALGGECQTASVSKTLMPGTYYLFVSVNSFDGYPCGFADNYVAELTGEDVFIPFYTVYRDGEAIADVYGESFADSDIMPGGDYCYTVTETVQAELETGVSNELCVNIPLYGLAVVNPESLSELHSPAPQTTTQTITITNDGDGVMEFAIGVELLDESKGAEAYCTGGPTSTIDSNVTLVDLEGEDSDIYFIGCPGVVGLQLLTNLVADLVPGNTYSVTITWGTCGGVYGNAGTVWIDWNSDQTFTADEIIGTWSGSPTVTQTYTFTVPANAVIGTTRMRVMQQEGGVLPLNPCATFSWGSMMDFGIDILPWLTVNPKMGTLNPGQSIVVDVTFNSTDLLDGVYLANLNVLTNNPFLSQPEVVVPVDFTVTNVYGELAVDPGQLTETHAPAPALTQQTILVSNVGDAAISFDVEIELGAKGSKSGNEWTVNVFDVGNWGDEVTWELRDNLGAVILSGGNYGIGYNDLQTVTTDNEPLEFYIEAIGTYGDNTPNYSVSCGGDVLVSGALLGGDEATYSDLSCASGGELCMPAFSSGCSGGDGIFSWSLANIQLANIPCTGEPAWYKDYTNLVHELVAGNTYTLTLTTQYPNNWFTIWVDLNNDYVLTPDEVFFSGQIALANTPTDYEITIPSDAPSGTFAVRVIAKWLSPAPADPCGSYSYGNVLDFMANITGVAPAEPWLSVAPEMGTLDPGQSMEVVVTFNSQDLDMGTYFANLKFFSSNPTIMQPEVVVPVQLTVGAPVHEILMTEGWNAWSSYINPDARMGMEDLMGPILDDMIVTQYFFELLYPQFGINTMGAFTNSHGYLTKMSAEATLEISGMMADPTVNLAAGWNLMPVLQECPITAMDVFANMTGIVIAWDPVGNGIYYPAAELYTLTTLLPGKAYWVKLDNSFVYTYPGCQKSGNPVGGASIRATNATPWNDVNYTPVNHAVVFNADAVATLETGDLIGAFTADGWLAGLAEVNRQAMGLQLFGDDFVTNGKDGFAEGEAISFRLFRPATTEEFEIEVTYSYDAPNSNGQFEINGISIVTGLKLAPTSVGSSLMNGLNIYPNPSGGVFNISVTNLDENVKFMVMNAQGQEVYSGTLIESQVLDLSSEPKGIYFIRFINNDVLGIKKLIIK